MLKKNVLFTLLALMAAIATLLSACGPTATPQATAAPVEPTADAAMSDFSVGIVLPTKDEQRWTQDETRFQDALTTAGYKAQILFSQGDSAKEKANVESLISSGIKVLIITPVDAAAAAAAADAARAAGVKVISYDRLVTGTEAVDFYVTFDSISVGKAQAQYLADKAKGKKGAPLYLYAGAATDNNAFLFFEGAWQVLQPLIADGTFVIKNSSEAVAVQTKATLTRDEMSKVVGQITTNWAPDVAKNLAEANLTVATAADKGDVFILAPNDDTARAIANTFVADKDVKSYVVTGQDAATASIQYIIDGKQSMTVFKDVRTLVADAITAAVTFLKGETPKSTNTYNNGKIDVPAAPSAVVTVDKSNVQSALIDSGYYPASDFTGLGGAAPAVGGKVGIVLPTKDEPRWIQDETRFKDALTKAGYDVQILFSQGDSAKEKANVESLISQGIKVLIITPHDAAAAASSVEAARAAGVKVVSYDRLVTGTEAVDFYVTFDSISVGKAQGQYLVDAAGSKKGAPLYLYAGAASDNNAFLFFEGAWMVLQPKIADGTFVIKNSSEAVAVQAKAKLTRDEMSKVIGQITTNWAPDVAKNLAEANLTVATAADKGDVFILAPNDGTARSIADTFAPDKDVKSYVVTGQDAEMPSIQYIIDSKQSMTVFKDVRTLVADAISAAVTFLKGETPKSTNTYNNGKIDVPAAPSAVVTVDKNNVQSALIDSGYYKTTDFTGLSAAAPAVGGKVGIVLPTKDEPRWIQDETRFKDALTKAGYDVQILFSQGDSAKEKANVEALISQGIKVLIICPHDAAAAASSVEAARAAGVKVVSYDRLVTGTDAVDFYVTFDSISVGKAQGQYLVDAAGSKKGNPLYLYAGAASDNNAFLFFEGAWMVLQPKIADGTFVIKNSSEAVAVQAKAKLTRDEMSKVIGQITTNWAPDVAKNLAEANLTVATAADKGDVFILAPNDGTARSIADTFAPDKDVKSYVVTGQDAEMPSIQYIIDSKQSMTVFKDVRTLVADAITAAITFLKGETPKSTNTYNNGKIDVPAAPSAVVTVDKNNVQSALIDTQYYKASDFTGLK